MTLVLWVIASIWGVSAVGVAIIFAIDERAHRRSASHAPAAPAPVAAAPKSSPCQQHFDVHSASA